MRAYPSLALVVNAAAGRVRPPLVEQVLRILAQRFQVAVFVGSEPKEIGDLARTAAQQAELVVALGGDGTASRVAAGVIGTSARFAVLPGGSTNHVARLLGFPDGPVRAARALVGPLRWRRLDVGRVAPDRVLLFLGGIGIDALIVDDASPSVKRFFAWRSYVLPGLRHLRDGPWSFQVDIDGRVRRVVARTILVANGPFLVHPHFRLGPSIDPSDGQLDVLCLRPPNLVAWAELFGWAALGRLWQSRFVERWRGQAVAIRSSVPAPVEIDGDRCTDADELRVTVQPGALVAAVPAFSWGVGEGSRERS
ncbi:MAG: hypothetical protein NZ696_01190 [Thermomicrobium sp.]|nr:hypothetical protein [Thermomicrobium sp.]MDW7982341.1 diacylglycerol kinase family protein [Thermomicrobium sp.]